MSNSISQLANEKTKKKIAEKHSASVDVCEYPRNRTDFYEKCN